MAISGQLTISGQTFQTICFQTATITCQVVKDRWFKYQKSPIDPPLANLRLFGKTNRHILLEDQATETGRWAHRRDGGDPAMSTMELEQLLQIYVAQAI